ncbi:MULTISPECIES: peptidyl-prolyl cis-trans isomerase [Colwellia]|uniref:PpiC domain-containing protein n=1 Tax=Colwellia marinimaniae TaxID=1513592 RepID=A0ABQ0MWS6_9GAMM|nr:MULTISPECIES: peptidylprolyl isomerase [Colwellia]GAW96810.1 hypothetical protein MTCD1_02433 [Colwellia marinimaniae]
MKTAFKKLIHEPLIHFLFISLGFFFVYDLLNPQTADESKIITISQNRVGLLIQGFEKTWTRPPTAQELTKIIDDYALNEIYSREAIALGLGENDEVIRRRLRQKMEFILQDISALQQPTTQELTQYFQQHSENYQEEALYSFEQKYLTTNRSSKQLKQLIAKQKQRILSGQNPQGDTSLIAADFAKMSVYHINRQFGKYFNEVLDKAPLNQWVGPVKSGLGLHFIKVSQRIDGKILPLMQVKEQVIKDWQHQQSIDFTNKYQQELLLQYDVIVAKQVSDLLSVKDSSPVEK